MARMPAPILPTPSHKLDTLSDAELVEAALRWADELNIASWNQESVELTDATALIRELAARVNRD